MNELQKKIISLKKEKNALILSHYYQPLEIQDISDMVGDSFALAKQAQAAKEDTLLLCGVRFMAESAKILNPEKTVYQPAESAGCPMADMITPEDVKKLRAEHPDAAVVCYVNSSAEVKAESDICCTSSSAEKVVASLPNKKIIFVPDRNLGGFVAERFPDKEVICFDGCCPIHDAIRSENAERMLAQHPGAKLLVHPECPKAVVALADYVGSTAGILSYARKSDEDCLIIGTENGVTEILRREMPNKEILSVQDNFLCMDMKKTNLEDIIDCLEGRRDPVTLSKDMMDKARTSLVRMVEVEK